MPPGDGGLLRDYLGENADRSARHLHSIDASIALSDLARGTSLGGRLPELRDRSVLIATGDQLTSALALIELDGVARRLVLCPPDLAPEHLRSVMADAEADALVSAEADGGRGAPGIDVVTCDPALTPWAAERAAPRQTEWVMFTSGTTGTPKMVQHSLAGLTAAIKRNAGHDGPPVWGTFYDIRRYGGLQIFFRALLDGGSLVLSSPKEPIGDHLARLGAHGATHVSGTPSHWRRALMSPSVQAMSPRYVRLSGEIADQAILDHLRACYPRARVGHAYASTEAGVGFEVDDGLAGFPAGMLGRLPSGVEMKVERDTLRIRSSRTAIRYVGGEGAALAEADGFVDTGDIVERHGDRYFFVGRSNGVINVGGLKVHPEEVEAVINAHPDVRMSLVRPRKSPITGSLVVADVVLRHQPGDGRLAQLQGEILRRCRESLTQHKVPTAIRFVPALAVAATGKLARHHA
ncbi:MAG TPA: class I adenylate-forming enzyme family protein [Xanthobacteraceae bacterium]|jgi:acyl-coenzyme A synthetase/AMP-(fatty) acid ligase|nr:class I adenylate-forming enzyme family protein [Xanthobacteraceae bacterium]